MHYSALADIARMSIFDRQYNLISLHIYKLSLTPMLLRYVAHGLVTKTPEQHL